MTDSVATRARAKVLTFFKLGYEADFVQVEFSKGATASGQELADDLYDELGVDARPTIKIFRDLCQGRHGPEREFFRTIEDATNYTWSMPKDQAWFGELCTAVADRLEERLSDVNTDNTCATGAVQ